MANASREGAERVSLPDHWAALKNSEKFAHLRDSSRLVRGSILANAEIDCRSRKIKDPDRHLSLKLNHPTRESSSFTLVDAAGLLVTGRMEVLSSDARRYDRIYLLGGASTFVGGQSAPRTLTPGEVSRIASLIETFHNRCSPAQLGRHIDVFVILTDRES